MKNNVLVELIITNQCNKRCKYCDLDFRSVSQSKDTLSDFSDFLSSNQNKVNSWLVNFFGGEPLLEFDLIKYFVSLNCDIKNLNYSLGTNGILLDEEKFLFFQKNNTEIYLSVDTETYEHILQKEFLLEYSSTIINFIINPNTIQKSFSIFESLVKFGYKSFNIIPVFSTIKWDICSFKELKSFHSFVHQFGDISIVFFSYYQKPTSDIQFILDTDNYFYRDLHTHLWIIKQLSFLDNSLVEEIQHFTQIGSLQRDLDVLLLVEKYDVKEVLKKSFSLAKYMNFERDFKVLDKILLG